MRIVPQHMTDVWLSGDFTGVNRPVARATVQQLYFTSRDFHDQRYASYLFGNPNEVVEIPNIKEVTWTRSTQNEAGTSKISLWNASPPAIGAPVNPEDPVPDQLGFYTFNRGDEQPNPWGHVRDYFNHRIYPDVLIRTYEGYGCTPTVSPEEDPLQLPSGVWLVDDVDMDSTGQLVLTCRDAGRLLTDQIVFPPIIPFAVYPLMFSKYAKVNNPKIPVQHISNTKGWVRPKYYTDSGVPYNGKNGTIDTHRPSDAMDSSTSSYWLSIGNDSPVADFSYEFVEGKLSRAELVSGVRIRTKGGPYRVYVSVYADGAWKGHSTIPYNPRDPVSAPNGANIRYIKHSIARRDTETTIGFTGVANVTHVRITFHDLWNSGVGIYPYRAAVRDFHVLTGESVTKTTYVDGGYHWDGNYNDYTDVVKWLLAYGGFFWPSDNSYNYQVDTAGNWDHYPIGWCDYINPVTGHLQQVWGGDPVLLSLNPDDTQLAIAAGVKIGAVWADLEQSGTYGNVTLTPDVFDKKPLMDGIAYIRDLTGMIFFIDETGAVIMRSPNIWSIGNWQIDPKTVRTVGRVSDMVVIHEKQTLTGLQAKLSSRNIRERIVIANLGGNFGAVTDGFIPYDLPDTGLRRVAIWSDQHFDSNDDCQTMADLVALRALFSYRTDSITLPGYPAIQVDDQVKLVEGTTEENYDIHYVMAISSTLSHDTGEWTYQIDTHWLGTEPYLDWAFNPAKLDPATQQYLQALGRIN